VKGIGRKKGGKNRPGSAKTGPKYDNLPGKFTSAEVAEIKKAVINLMEAEEVDNVSQAADYLGVPKVRMYSWYRNDPEWRKEVHYIDDIKADRLESTLDKSGNVIGIIFRLKKLRPEYRDSHKFKETSERIEQFLATLTKLAQESKTEVETLEGKFKELPQGEDK
jgi:hypothetical protein